MVDASAPSGEPLEFHPDPSSALQPFPPAEMVNAYLLAADDSLDMHSMHHGFTEYDYWTLDVDRFRLAWEVAFHRHDALRVSFFDGACSI